MRKLLKIAPFILMISLCVLPFAEAQEKSPEGKAKKASEKEKLVSDWIRDLSRPALEKPDHEKVLAQIGPGDEHLVPLLTQALKKANFLTKAYLARALGNIGPNAEKAVPALIKMIGDFRAYDSMAKSDPVMMATLALGKIGPKAEKAIPALVKLLKNHESYHVRVYAAQSLGKIGPKAQKAVPAIVKLLDHKREFFRLSAALALGNLAPLTNSTAEEKVVSVLTNFLADKSSSTHQQSCSILAKFGSKAEKAIPALIQLLESEDVMLRFSVVSALGSIGEGSASNNKKIVPALTKMLGDKEWFVRFATGNALVTLGERNMGMPILLSGLKAKDSGTRRVVAYTLGSIGDKGKDVLDALNEALTDQDKRVREAAKQSLEKLRAQSKK